MRLQGTFADFFWVRVRETQHALVVLSCWHGAAGIQREPHACPHMLYGEKVQATWQSSAHVTQTCPPPGTHSASGITVVRAELLVLAHSAVTVWRPQGAVPKPMLCFEPRFWVRFPVHRGGSPSQLHGVSLGLPLWARKSRYC